MLRFFINMNLRFIFIIAEVHRLGPARILILRAIASRITVELSVQRGVHSRFKSRRVDTENFRPSDPV